MATEFPQLTGMKAEFEAKHPRANPAGRGKFSKKPNSDPETPIEPADLSGSWQTQHISVFGRKFALGDVSGGRLYHGSRASMQAGSVLTPGHAKNFSQSPSESISITSDPAVAQHWARQSGDGPFYVYEVEPVGPVDAWRVIPAEAGASFRLLEGRCGSAVVIGVTPPT